MSNLKKKHSEIAIFQVGSSYWCQTDSIIITASKTHRITAHVKTRRMSNPFQLRHLTNQTHVTHTLGLFIASHMFTGFFHFSWIFSSNITQVDYPSGSECMLNIVYSLHHNFQNLLIPISLNENRQLSLRPHGTHLIQLTRAKMTTA